MIHSSHRDRKAKAIAEVLAMIEADLPLAPHRPRPVLETEEWLFESATEFIEAREKYYAERAVSKTFPVETSHKLPGNADQTEPRATSLDLPVAIVARAVILDELLNTPFDGNRDIIQLRRNLAAAVNRLALGSVDRGGPLSGSLGMLIDDLDRLGIKPRDSKFGRFVMGPLAHILKNRFYVGEVAYRGEVHEGEHPPIIDKELFQATQAKLQARAVDHRVRWSRSPSFLSGLIYDDRDNRMSPSHANKRGARYRYYVSQALLQNRDGHRTRSGGR